MFGYSLPNDEPQRCVGFFWQTVTADIGSRPRNWSLMLLERLNLLDAATGRAEGEDGKP